MLTSGPISKYESVLAVFWVFESVADLQKARFADRTRRDGVRRTCDIGLWRYSRHPNYFGQWMQWSSLILLSLPVLIDRWPHHHIVFGLLTVLALAWISWTTYHMLVHYTGAVPAEHFSRNDAPTTSAISASPTGSFPGPDGPLINEPLRVPHGRRGRAAGAGAVYRARRRPCDLDR